MVVVNPLACFSISGALASCGKLSATREIFSLTSFAATSKSIEVSNSILISARPICAVESICFTPSTPPMTSSKISTISLEIISAEAPS